MGEADPPVSRTQTEVDEALAQIHHPANGHLGIGTGVPDRRAARSGVGWANVAPYSPDNVSPEHVDLVVFEEGSGGAISVSGWS